MCIRDRFQDSAMTLANQRKKRCWTRHMSSVLLRQRKQ
ncbi:hypothetical protein T4E_7049 [Trichinella pseudospiralis]|uniref:Uncharacterized protein n=1 Tax=Trichinella pseudospiralis TaxID=6337 RepID=A0A0V0Y4R3_TRIPS|nr:hypothetical protein T4E_7935 [Trichinella pseudospiralis]KRX95387.1 hypothetical protein T4E_7049 [Trichinella pseudospiralis]